MLGSLGGLPALEAWVIFYKEGDTMPNEFTRNLQGGLGMAGSSIVGSFL
jgi:hypothetical protein